MARVHILPTTGNVWWGLLLGILALRMHSRARRPMCVTQQRVLSVATASCREVRLLRGTQALPEFSCSFFEICRSTEPGTLMGWCRKKLKCQILSIKPKHHSPGPPTVGTTDEACGIWNKWQAPCKPGVKATQPCDMTWNRQVTYFVMDKFCP